MCEIILWDKYNEIAIGSTRLVNCLKENNYIQPSETSTIMKKTCKECSDTFVGRADAKFCSDQCRSAYNNRINGYQSSYIRKINAVLRRNRKILEELNTGNDVEVTASQLGRMGFDFSFFTTTYTTASGHVHLYCYDQGYFETEPDVFKLVTRDDFED